MSIKVTCGSCNKALVAREELVGKRVRCPGCKHLVLVLPPTGQRADLRVGRPPDWAPPPFPPPAGQADEGAGKGPADTPLSGVLVPWLVAGAAGCLFVISSVLAFTFHSRSTSYRRNLTAAEQKLQEADNSAQELVSRLGAAERKRQEVDAAGEKLRQQAAQAEGKARLAERLEGENNTLRSDLAKLTKELTEAKAALAKAPGEAGRPTAAAGEKGKSPHAPEDDKDLPRQGAGDPKLTYEVVSKDPSAYRGKRVTWPGEGWGGSSPGAREKGGESEVLMAVNPEAGDARLFKVYVVRIPPGASVVAILTKGKCRVTATVVGSTSISYNVTGPGGVGQERKTATVPLLRYAAFN